MIVALARKLIIALWRFVTTGETLEGVILRPASWTGASLILLALAFRQTAELTIRGGGTPYSNMALMPTAFLADFGPVGTVNSIDFFEEVMTCHPSTNCRTLDFLATTHASATAALSSGEVVFADVTVPEPASLALLGAALFGLGALRRRRN